MKPKNFPGRKDRRWVRALRRKGVPMPQFHEAPKDIKIRMGAAARKEFQWH
jgi:hypothetical protein